jgi:large subunit ribosomal protein L24
MARIKKGDTVIVIAGASKGTTGTVVSVDTASSRVLVEGVAIKKHFMRKTGDKGAGGSIVEKPSFVHISNVALVDPKTKKPTRVGMKVEKGEKVRVAKKSGTVLSK